MRYYVFRCFLMFYTAFYIIILEKYSEIIYNNVTDKSCPKQIAKGKGSLS